MYKLTAFAILVLLSNSAQTQDNAQDTAAYRQRVETAINSYHQLVGTQAELYNGSEYWRHLPSIEGIPYFGADAWQNGTIEYRGIVYRNIPMKYDMVRDLVVLKHPNGFSSFSLFSPRVTYFTLFESRFIYIDEEENETAPPPGFYQQLNKGFLTFMAKRSMRIEETIEDRTIRRNFKTTDQYYLFKGGKYYHLKNEGTLLSLVGGDRNAVKQTLRRKSIRFKKNPEQAIIAVAEYFNL